MTRTRRELLAASIVPLAGCQAPAERAPGEPFRSATSADHRVGFVGDLMFGRDVDAVHRDGPADAVWGSMHEHLQSLDGVVANLECCVSERGERWPDKTFYFRADPDWVVPALGAGNVAAVSLANNHLLDFGETALLDTLDHLSTGGIAHAGAGPNAAAALEPTVVDAGGLRVGVLGLTDQWSQFGAGPDSPGTAHVALSADDEATRRAVRNGVATARESGADLVVASLHWGPNWEVEPSTDQQRFARWLIDEGVDVVHGHSAHVIQGVETHRGRPIIYDAGDFVDDYAIKEGLHNDRSFLFELVVDGGEPTALELRPVEIVDERVERAGDDAAAWLRDRMHTLSGPFGTTVERSGRGVRIPLDGGEGSTSGNESGTNETVSRNERQERTRSRRRVPTPTAFSSS